MKKLEPFFDTVGEILAVVLVATYVIILTNAKWDYIQIEMILDILQMINMYGALALVGIVGMEAMSKRHVIFRIAFILALAFIFVFLFMPETYAQIMG